MRPIIVWFEDDLRLTDHHAWLAATRTGQPVIALFVWDGGKGWAEGGASRWWLHESLTQFREQIEAPLIIRQGAAEDVLPRLASELSAEAVHIQERPDTTRASRDRAISGKLAASGVQFRTFGGALMHDPDQIRTQGGAPFRVFTPFHKRLLAEMGGDPAVAPRPSAAGVPGLDHQGHVSSLALLPRVKWYERMASEWTPGEAGGRTRLKRVPQLDDYHSTRDFPWCYGTSRLSPHLHFGEVSIREAWKAANGNGPYQRQLAWREFAYHVMHHFPRTADEPLRSEYAAFPWRHVPEELQRWQTGQTGYPIVDAGMRQLWSTGWMHNRVRMIVASFLTKHLLHSWRHGQAWFNDTLVDADTANNTLGWQWAAGCGADAQPFFRIFNPTLQGKRFDPHGEYVRTWIPELASVPDAGVHEPWEQDQPPAGYPGPIVDHAFARVRALEAFSTFQKSL